MTRKAILGSTGSPVATLSALLTTFVWLAGAGCCGHELHAQVTVDNFQQDRTASFRNQETSPYLIDPPIVEPSTAGTREDQPDVLQPHLSSSVKPAIDPVVIQDAVKSPAVTPPKPKSFAKQIAGAHKPLYFLNDFSYVCDPEYNDWYLGDGLKERALPFGGTVDFGGEFRMRYHAERNHRGLGLTGVDDDFLLRRTRFYGDFRPNDNLRVYAELLDAQSSFENFSPRPIEENRFDMLNLFVETSLLTVNGYDVSTRVGRQELLFGAQRAISPLDWANTRRTFEGVRVTAKNKNRTFDGFWTNPVNVDNANFDSPDRDQEFMGLYSSYRGIKNQTTDVYLLRYLNGRGANDFEANTIGFRNAGNRGSLLWDVEAAYQFGENTDGSDKAAGMLTAGIGKKYGHLCWKPTLWFFYDYASGDNNLGSGNGYHHLFPLAHKYNGFMDLFGRRNLEDVNLQLKMSPNKRWTFLVWYHYFFLASQSDSPYSVVMTPFNGGNAPGSTDLGHEIDLIAKCKVSPRQDLLIGYSHFFSGDYYSTTPGVPYDGDANFSYIQWSTRF